MKDYKQDMTMEMERDASEYTIKECTEAMNNAFKATFRKKGGFAGTRMFIIFLNFFPNIRSLHFLFCHCIYQKESF